MRKQIRVLKEKEYILNKEKYFYKQEVERTHRLLIERAHKSLKNPFYNESKKTIQQCRKPNQVLRIYIY